MSVETVQRCDWTFIGADGTVRARAVGEMTIADLETTIATIGR